MSDLPLRQTQSRFSDPIVRSFPDVVNRYRPRMALATKHEHGLFIDGETTEPASGELRELVEPVNATLSTPGCLTRYAPAVGPSPGTMLIAPGGKPTSPASSAIRSTLSGV